MKKKSITRITSSILALALLLLTHSFNVSSAQGQVVINELESSPPTEGNDWV